MNTVTLLRLPLPTQYTRIANYLKSVLAEKSFFRENMFRSPNVQQMNVELLWLRSGWRSQGRPRNSGKSVSTVQKILS